MQHSNPRRLRGRWLDIVGLTLAFAYGVPTLWYRFGRDQAIFHYVGREWLRGRLPYRDAFDVKPPAIYVLHAVAIAVFGANEWGIRLLELFAVLGGSWLIASAVQRDRPRRDGEIGIVAIAFSGFYFTIFDFWDSGQVEIWEGLFLIASYVVVERAQEPFRAALIGGALASIAVMFKLTAGLVGVSLGGVMAVRAATLAKRRGWTANPELLALASLVTFGVGAACVVLIFVGYYVAHGAFHSLIELAQYVKEYSRTGWGSMSPREDITAFWMRAGLWAIGCLFAWIAAIVQSCTRRAAPVVSGAAVAMLMLALSIATVAAQNKFFSYHWGVCVPFLVLLFAYGVAECAWFSVQMTFVAALGWMATGFVTAPPWLANERVTQQTYVIDHWWERVRQRERLATFLGVFRGISGFSYANEFTVARAIRARMQPGDRLHVRGFEVGIYDITGLSTPSRFVSEIPIEVAPSEFKTVWKERHEALIWSVLPRFVVAFVDRPVDVREIRERGYHDIARVGLFVVLEREGGANAGSTNLGVPVGARMPPRDAARR